jgi:hypothetical protein
LVCCRKRLDAPGVPTVAAIVAYVMGWKVRKSAERLIHGALLAVPLTFWVCLFGSAFLLAWSGD